MLGCCSTSSSARARAGPEARAGAVPDLERGPERQSARPPAINGSLRCAAGRLRRRGQPVRHRRGPRRPDRRARAMALVYGNATTDFFFGLLNNTLVTDTLYATLSRPWRHRSWTRPPDRSPTTTSASSCPSPAASTRDYARCAQDGRRRRMRSRRDRRPVRREPPDDRRRSSHATPSLQPLCDAFAASGDPPTRGVPRCLRTFLPALERQRKRQQALQRDQRGGRTDPPSPRRSSTPHGAATRRRHDPSPHSTT